MRIKSGWHFYLINLKAGIRSFIKNIDYFRFREYLIAIKEISSDSGCYNKNKVLDIGCGEEIFGIFLAKSKDFEVYAIDINQEKINLQKKYFRRLKDNFDSFNAELVDAKKMPYVNNTFDLVTCFAVLPLIKGDEDIKIVKEISRVLKIGGVAYITVGYGKDYREQWNAVSTKGFSRVYNETELKKRIINGSGLELQKRLYFGEPKVKFSRFWYRLPFLVRLPFRWLMPLLTVTFLKSINPDMINERNLDIVDGIFLVLKKS